MRGARVGGWVVFWKELLAGHRPRATSALGLTLLRGRLNTMRWRRWSMTPATHEDDASNVNKTAKQHRTDTIDARDSQSAVRTTLNVFLFFFFFSPLHIRLPADLWAQCSLIQSCKAWSMRTSYQSQGAPKKQTTGGFYFVGKKKGRQKIVYSSRRTSSCVTCSSRTINLMAAAPVFLFAWKENANHSLTSSSLLGRINARQSFVFFFVTSIRPPPPPSIWLLTIFLARERNCWPDRVTHFDGIWWLRLFGYNQSSFVSTISTVRFCFLVYPEGDKRQSNGEKESRTVEWTMEPNCLAIK